MSAESDLIIIHFTKNKSLQNGGQASIGKCSPEGRRAPVSGSLASADYI